MRRKWLILAVFLCTLGCDHATKRAAETTLRDREAVIVVPGAVNLVYRENPGFAFSLERYLPAAARTPLLVGAGVVALAALAVAWRRRRDARWAEGLGWALVAAGAAGNLVDRVARGAVIDFIHVRGWPVFNVADVAIAAGMALLLFFGPHTSVSGRASGVY